MRGIIIGISHVRCLKFLNHGVVREVFKTCVFI